MVNGAPGEQRLIWRVEYDDGELVEEYTPSGVETRFEDVEKERLRRFWLADVLQERRPVVVLECETGEFRVKRGTLAFELGGLRLTGQAGADYRRVVQWKQAHATWRPGVGSSGNVIDAHGIGYAAEVVGGRYEVVLVLPVNGEPPRVEAKVRPADEVSAEEFRVLLNDVPVRSGDELAAALGARAPARTSTNGWRGGG